MSMQFVGVFFFLTNSRDFFLNCLNVSIFFCQRFTKTKTMTVLTGGSDYVYHGDGADAKYVEKHSESR